MKTPIFDFVKNYAKQNKVRAHMPAHKGRRGIEKYDITEISGADVLYSESGIIAASQQNAANIFGTAMSIYSCEGSTLSIKAMLGVVAEGVKNRKPLVLAGRNAHKAFVNACALLDIEVEWLYGEADNLCECKIEANTLKNELLGIDKKVDAVYITSPDYLGNIADIKGLSAVCEEFNIPLIVDNAHGAYLKFLEQSKHPIDLGAAMAADSAHKTLPVLTGGAYLHINKKYAHFGKVAKRKMQLFASTSPSYLIMQSLDLANAVIGKEYFKKATDRTALLKQELIKMGYTLIGSESLKITLNCALVGYNGEAVAEILRAKNIECEYADDNFVTLMLSPENTAADYRKIKKALACLDRKEPMDKEKFSIARAEKVMSIRDAVFTMSESVDVENAVGRICAAPTVSCPPAIPVCVSGERITEQSVKILKAYKIAKIDVVKEV